MKRIAAKRNYTNYKTAQETTEVRMLRDEIVSLKHQLAVCKQELNTYRANLESCLERTDVPVPQQGVGYGPSSTGPAIGFDEIGPIYAE